MGIDYGCYLGIGFITDKETVLAPFRKVLPEVSHMEDRFDQKTGKKLAPVKVVDEGEGEEFVFDGRHYDDDFELFEAIGKKLNCSIGDTGGYTEGTTVYIEVDVDTDDGGVDDGRFTVGGAATFADVTALRAQLTKLKRDFKKLGIELDEPMVFPAYSIS